MTHKNVLSLSDEEFVKALSIERTEDPSILRAIIFGIRTDDVGAAFVHDIVEAPEDRFVDELEDLGALNGVELVKVKEDVDEAELIGSCHWVLRVGEADVVAVAMSHIRWSL